MGGAEELDLRAQGLTRAAGVLDLHVDSIIQQRLFGYDPRRAHRAGVRGQPFFWHCDIPRMIEAGYVGAAMGIHAWNVEYEGAWDECRRQLDVLDELAADPRCVRVGGAVGWTTPAGDARLRLSAGVEGAHMLNGRLERVAELAARKVSYMTLVHLRKNSAATPGFGIKADDRSGLTGYGVELIAELERCGIVVDLAHLNDVGVVQAAWVANRPVVCTHTGVAGVHRYGRNIGNAALDAIVRTGGIIGIMFAPQFLVGRLRADSKCVADHIEFVAKRAGVAHVAIGTDYDGWIASIPSDQRDCRDLWRVVRELLARGWSDADVKAVLSGNAQRVFGAA